MFQLNQEEYDSLRSQIGTLKRGEHSKYLPYAFTEQGVAMLSGILHSKVAVQVNIAIMRAFVFLRQYALTHKELTHKLKELEARYDRKFSDIYEVINYLLQKEKQQTLQQELNRIGYNRAHERTDSTWVIQVKD